MPLYPMPDDEEDQNLPGDDANYKRMLLQQLKQQQQPMPQDNGNNALIAGLNQSFSKLGTVGGKTADTSDVTRYASVLDQMKAARQQQDMAKTAQQNRILESLAALKDKNDQKQLTIGLQQQRLQQSQDQKLSEHDFQRQQQDRLFNQQKDLATVKAEKKPGAATLAVDKEFGKDYNDFVVKGGYGNVQKGIQQLNTVAETLGNDNSLTGPLAGRTPNFIRSFTNPKAVDMQQQVEDVVQRSLKDILGAQFTEKEGERILARAYDPTLSPQVNKEKVLRLAKSLKTAAESKLNAAKYYEQNGTLQGFKGTLANGVDDILNDIDGPSEAVAKGENAPSGDTKMMSMPGPASSPMQAKPAQLDAQAPGSFRIVNGKKFTKGPDGLWHEAQ